MKDNKDHPEFIYNQVAGQMKRVRFIQQKIEEYSRQSGKSPAEISVLEVGCGCGNISLPLARLGYTVVGMDIDQASIEHIVKESRYTNAGFFVGDADHVPIHHREFDVIICTEVLEHLATPSKLLIATTRLLKTDGLMIATIPNEYTPFKLVTLLLGGLNYLFHRSFVPRRVRNVWLRSMEENITVFTKYVSRNTNSPHMQHFTVKSFKSLLRDHGYSVAFIKNAFFGSIYLHAPLINLVIKRDSRLFNVIDRIDSRVADWFPRSLVAGWYFICHHPKVDVRGSLSNPGTQKS